VSQTDTMPSSTQGGFTLIETVVALVVLAIGAGVVLQHLRSLIVRAEKEQAYVIEAMQLLNESSRLPHWPLTSMQLLTTREGTGLYAQRLTMTWPGLPNAPAVEVKNFSLIDQPLPPLDLAYTPGQRFILEKGRLTLSRLAPSLTPPNSGDANVDSDKAINVLKEDRDKRREVMQAAERAAEQAEKAEQQAQQAAAQKQAAPETSGTPAKGSAAP